MRINNHTESLYYFSHTLSLLFIGLPSGQCGNKWPWLPISRLSCGRRPLELKSRVCCATAAPGPKGFACKPLCGAEARLRTEREREREREAVLEWSFDLLKIYFQQQQQLLCKRRQFSSSPLGPLIRSQVIWNEIIPAARSLLVCCAWHVALGRLF